jgi:hypothetical protein
MTLYVIGSFFHALAARDRVKDLLKTFFDQATIGGDTIIPLSLRLSRIEFSLV